MGSLKPVPLTHIDKLWPAAHRLLSPAIERTHGEDNAETVFMGLVRGERQLWLYGDPPTMAAITKLATYETGKRTAVVMLMGGEGLNTIDRIADIELWAAFNNCHAVEVCEGRRGLERVLPGYSVAGVHYIKEL